MMGAAAGVLEETRGKGFYEGEEEGCFRAAPPRVLFVDEKGNYRSYEFEPVALNVTELGIAGWLKGPK